MFLGAHPDDNLIGCGGILSRIKKTGKTFHCYTFTCNSEERRREWLDAMDYICPTSYKIFDFRGDSLPDHRYEVRRILEEVKNYEPDIVFTHSLRSIHQSHRALAEEAERIMRHITILGYAETKSNPYFTPRVFIELTEEEMEEKLKLISFFKSQTSKFYLSPEAIRATARVYGLQVNVEYADAFDVCRIKVNKN